MSSLAHGGFIAGDIAWATGSMTTIAAPTVEPVSATKCPGYVKKASSNPAAYFFAAMVITDTGDGVLLPANVSGEACVAPDGTITLLKTVKFKWTPSSIKCSTISGNESSMLTVSGCRAIIPQDDRIGFFRSPCPPAEPSIGGPTQARRSVLRR